MLVLKNISLYAGTIQKWFKLVKNIFLLALYDLIIAFNRILFRILTIGYLNYLSSLKHASYMYVGLDNNNNKLEKKVSMLHLRLQDLYCFVTLLKNCST